MRKDRLLKLADFLETIPRKAFDLKRWAKSNATKPEGEKPGECGFAGCAVGWAVHTKMFRGLKFDTKDATAAEIVYGGASGWEAVGRLFDISDGGFLTIEGEAEFLFHSDRYDGGNATPLQVAKRIREFVRSH